MSSATTLNDEAPQPVRAPRLLGLYLLLILIAAIEAFDGLSHAPMLFGDMSEIPAPASAARSSRRTLRAIPCWRWRRWGLPPSAGCVTRSWRSARSCS
ncbi:hypothetical protein ACF1BQ_008860 [Bradyrhizobium sp. RDT10]